jgi:formate hydrogenlyase transcriptional activator
MHRFAASNAKEIEDIDLRTLGRLESYDWPGNIRELQNVVERAVILCEGDTLSIDEAWLRPLKACNARSLNETLSSRQREMIEAALHESCGLVAGPSGAAAKLGIPRTTLESRIRTLRIDKFKFKIALSE